MGAEILLKEIRSIISLQYTENIRCNHDAGDIQAHYEQNDMHPIQQYTNSLTPNHQKNHFYWQSRSKSRQSNPNTFLTVCCDPLQQQGRVLKKTTKISPKISK